MESNSEQTTTFTDSVVFEIIKEFGARAEKGYNKYGTDMDRTDLSVADWCQHLREELMDGLVYLTRLKKDIIQLEEELEVLRARNVIEQKKEWQDLTAGIDIVYNIIPKPSQTYTDEEPVIRKRYGFHR
jgi:hypothetical protein